MSNYIRHLLTSWVAVDPDPQYSRLDRLDIRCGEIGEDPREVEIPEPVEEPILVPVETPEPTEVPS